MALNFVIGGREEHPLTVDYEKSTSQLGAKVAASFPVSDSGPNVSVSLGDTVKVYDDWDDKFIGMVTDVRRTDQRVEITAYDPCYFLSRSKRTMQFDGIRVDEALSALWRDCGFFNHHCPDMPTVVEAVSYIQTPADIAKNLIQKETDANGGEYYLTAGDFNSVEVYRLGELVCGAELKLISSPTCSVSLDGVRNRVTLVSTDGGGAETLETASDEKSVVRYGLLAEIVTVSSDASAAVVTAQNRLKSLSRILHEGSVTVPGDWALTACGQRIRVTEPLSGLDGWYVITSVRHQLGDDFRTTLELREYVEPETEEVEDVRRTLAYPTAENLDWLARSRGSVLSPYPVILPFASGKCRLTSRYGYRTHPVTGQVNSFHGGIDLVGIDTLNGDGETVVASLDGTVVQSRIVTDKSNATWQWGNYVAVQGDDGYTIYYAHLASRSVQVGQRVRQGQPLGIEGTTGQSTGVHLHFEVRRGTERVSAADYLGIPNDPGTYGNDGGTIAESASAQSIAERMMDNG